MKISISPDSAGAVAQTARHLADRLRVQPRLVLGLATGRTMEALYAQLVAWHRASGLDFSQCQTFNLDEYVGQPATDPHSYRHYMEHHLFRHVNVRPEQTHLPDGCAPDLTAECRRYEAEIEAAGGVDVQLLGIGNNGHLGFNEPPARLDSRTRVQTLAAATRAQNAPLFARPDAVPTHALTLGLANILASRQCVLLATGAAKAEILARALAGTFDPQVPASALLRHPDVWLFLDAAAAQKLPAGLTATPP